MATQLGLTQRQKDAIGALASTSPYAGKSKIAILRELPWSKKISYFKEHFLVPLIAIAVIISFLSFLIARVTSPEHRPILYVAVLDNAMTTSEAVGLQNKLESKFDDEVIVDDYFNMSKDGLTKLQTMLSSKQIDAIIAPRKTFVQLAGYGYLSNLETSFGQSNNAAIARSEVRLHGFNDADDEGFDSSGSGKGAKKSYGLELDGANQWNQSKDVDDSALIGIASGTHNNETARQFINWLYQ